MPCDEFISSFRLWNGPDGLKVPARAKVPLLLYALRGAARSFFLSDIAGLPGCPTKEPKVSANREHSEDINDAVARLKSILFARSTARAAIQTAVNVCENRSIIA